MARKTQRPDDIVWTVTEAHIERVQSDAKEASQYETPTVLLGALLDTLYPRKAMVKLFDEKLIHVDGHKATPKTEVAIGSEVWIAMAKEKIDYEPVAMDLQIVYEDDDLLILDKPAGVTVNSPNQVSLANGVAHYFREHGIKRKVRFLNRLDRDTTGCIVIAKSGLAQSLYQQQMDDDRFEKWYTAIVEGIIPSTDGLLSTEGGLLELPMRRSADGIHYEVHESGVMTRTEYRVIKKNDKRKSGIVHGEDTPMELAVDNFVDNDGADVDNVDKSVDNFTSAVGNTYRRHKNDDIDSTLQGLEIQINTSVSGCTKVEIRLWTGKTHQIRVAFSHCGHPLVGDSLYGGQMTENSFQLRATKVVFDHIRTGDRMIVEV
ncbi:RluA family pseudouridine synthase [Veillonella agrestimuris]|uniref:RluA family pseudouridine synthase n=1 Tax=Veillonella agrestimuris TaxID=2941340 RepID=UPI0020412CAD|nr:RluA family pseudouridine synthase [Veillonella agrestimuris]